ncbi:glycosyltransferase [Sporolactobacillus sp. KGMB 08714]|uniref:glycosyltransferase n=1 Tax=Sporolactobacillus sp. KGMB 08714 TaxID=3064704 RepID=UPI002FBDA0B1
MQPIPVKFTHLERMTDDTGLLEHAIGSVPRRGEGYTTDDNARALWAASDWFHFFDSRKNANRAQDKEKLLRLSHIYLAFLSWTQQPDGHFYNNYSYDRDKEQEMPSDDCLGRTLWGLAVAAIHLPHPDSRFAAKEIFRKGMDALPQLTHSRGQAYTLSALSTLLRHAQQEHEPDSFDTFIKSEAPGEIWLLEKKLINLYVQNKKDGWYWFEAAMTYGNGVLPWALLQSQRVTGNQEALRIAHESLDFLIEKMAAADGTVHPIGNKGWCTPEAQSRWDQQPLEVLALALASEAAAKSLHPEKQYLDIIRKCHAWFYGANDLHVPAANLDEGGGYDGLRPDGLNRNQGAESTLSYLLTELIYTRTILTNNGEGRKSMQTV